jgi:O-acetyl-ADP-ribose deacetylase (regulator of RNase III)
MITYLKGDATEPVGEGRKIIAHICNDIGAWGSGFVMAVSRKWPLAKEAYHKWHKSMTDGLLPLGEVQFVTVEKTIQIANMVGQHGIHWCSTGPRQFLQKEPPIRYGALQRALKKVAEQARESGATIHMPRIGTDRAGGSWDRIGPIIELSVAEIPVYVYDLP